MREEMRARSAQEETELLREMRRAADPEMLVGLPDQVAVDRQEGRVIHHAGGAHEIEMLTAPRGTLTRLGRRQRAQLHTLLRLWGGW